MKLIMWHFLHFVSHDCLVDNGTVWTQQFMNLSLEDHHPIDSTVNGRHCFVFLFSFLCHLYNNTWGFILHLRKWYMRTSLKYQMIFRWLSACRGGVFLNEAWPGALSVRCCLQRSVIALLNKKNQVSSQWRIIERYLRAHFRNMRVRDPLFWDKCSKCTNGIFCYFDFIEFIHLLP